ncbi:MAG: hypothetical protein ABEJ83_05540 [Candidatus Nanohaloarchaea archaeon]
MANEFLEAVKDSGSKDSSEDRYEKLKQEEAGTEYEDMAERRYKELKEKAKRESIRQEQKARKRQEESEDDEEDDGSDGFVTY